MMPTKSKKTSVANPNFATQLRQHKLIIGTGLLVAGALYAAVPQLSILDNSRDVLSQSNYWLALIAASLLFVSYGFASGIYMLLTTKSLRFGMTYIVQMAGSFASRALPAGIGSISVNYLYLRARGMSRLISGTVVAINNTLGFAGHFLWVVIALISAPSQLLKRHIDAPTIVWIGLVVFIGISLMVWLFRRRFVSVLRQTSVQIRRAHPSWRQLGFALVLSMGITACYITILWLSGQALGLSFGLVAALVALTTGVVAQTATPTPGGLGGAEAGLIAGLVLGGVPASSALAAVLLYRVVTYWLPLMVGGAALWFVLRRGYIR